MTHWAGILVLGRGLMSHSENVKFHQADRRREGYNMNYIDVYQNMQHWLLLYQRIICSLGVFRPKREFFTRMETSPLPVKGCIFWPMLGTHGHWTVRVLYCDTGHPFLYPTHAEDIMFLTRHSVSQSVSPVFLVSATPETAQQNFVKLCSNEGHNV